MVATSLLLVKLKLADMDANFQKKTVGWREGKEGSRERVLLGTLVEITHNLTIMQTQYMSQINC